jgi:formate hydrogenlyase subunit 3/multisubunit Na+/H+ antiporter MnhD subunit
MYTLISAILLPLGTGLLLLLVPERYRTAKGIIALIASIVTGWLVIEIFRSGNFHLGLGDPGSIGSYAAMVTSITGSTGKYVTFNIDNLSKLILLFISLFAFLVLLYSLVYIKNSKVKNFYPWFMVTLGSSNGAVVSDNLFLFLFFWGILGITLYKLICSDNEGTSAAAKKTLILIGASDSIMIAGIAIIWKVSGSLNMSSICIPTTDVISVTAFLALLIGSFTKAGAFPFHSWVPDYSENAPVSSSAFLPASLDKLLGIYFLARLTHGMFSLNEWIRVLLLTIGVVTIITAVMMALIQHNYKKLLGFHAVSQVGYMILGFGLGSMIGVAAGLFHLINNAIYKSGLFLSSGCVEYRTGKHNIDDLGGLSKAMPVTFFTSLIFAMSISGVPPFNGFASKWMIYQGIIDFGNGPGVANKLWFVWLGLAVLGSALTLASFIKLIGGIFLSRRNRELSNVKEAPVLMLVPPIILALLCIGFGIFATNYIVPKLLMPVSGEFQFTGFWNSVSVSFLVVVSIIIGIVLYLSLGTKKFRREDSFIGGEKIQELTSYPTPEFYKTLTEFRFIEWIYKKAEEKWFDIYDLCKKIVLWVSHVFSEVHTGVLPGYILWVFAGLIIMLLIMI